MANDVEDVQAEDINDGDNDDNNANAVTEADGCTAASRRERRKVAKKEKRKKKRQELAELARREDEARMHDPEELRRLQAEEEQDKLRVERERREFEERERKIIEEWERRKAQEQREEEERSRRAQEEEEQAKQNQIGYENEEDENGWEYVEDGPPEIIWQGNEIIVKKKKIRVKKNDKDQHIVEEDPNRPTSNPLPPESEAFSDYKNAPVLSAQELLENVAQETPNFGTEQDKAHCPFHLKTGACRFGSRCSRIHFYPDKSCTLLIKNMYNGPGLAWEQDEGLEYTDEEVERAYEEFYEDVHTEFLKFGEIINFKVCRNGSSHLRGNVYVHYKSLDSAVMAYHSVNGRYYAGKQLQCEFVGITRWKVAICGEFMKSKLQTCSRGTACNFIHCFRNPGGDYEWADWDKPPPKYWLKKMAALFGNSDEYGCEKQSKGGSPRLLRNSSRISADDTYSYRHRSRRSQSREICESRRLRKYSEEDTRSTAHGQHHRTADRKQLDVLNEDSSNSREKHHCKNRKLEAQSGKSDATSIHNSDSDTDNYNHHGDERKRRRHKEKRYSTGSKGHWWDKDRIKDLNSSCTVSGGWQQDQESTPPSDHWYVRGSARDSTVSADCSDEEQDSAHVYKEKSMMRTSSDELEDKKSARQSARRRKHTSIRDEEVEHDNGSPSDYGQRYGSPGSNRRHRSRKDSSEMEWGEPKKQYKKSKGERERDEKFNSEIHEGKSSRSTEHRIDDKVVNRRGRWEPNDGDSAQDSLIDDATDQRGRWEP